MQNTIQTSFDYNTLREAVAANHLNIGLIFVLIILHTDITTKAITKSIIQTIYILKKSEQ